MKKSTIVIGAITIFLIGNMTSVTAESTIRDITAQVNAAIKIKLNGNDFTPTDKSGKTLSPIIYGGNSYLPVRAIGEANNIAVDWDDQNKTIILGSHEGKGKSLIDYKSTNWGTESVKDPDILTIKGKTYDSGIFVKDVVSSAYMIFDTSKRFQTLTFKAGVLGEGITTIEVRDYRKDDLLKTIDVSDKDPMIDIQTDISGTDSIKLVINTSKNKQLQKVVITDAYLN